MAIEQVAEKVVEEVATNLEDAANVTRHINTAAVGSFMGGTGFGILLGFWYGMRFNREKIRQEAFEESKKEVESIKAQYATAQEAVIEARSRRGLTTSSLQIGEKPALEGIVKERGYDVPKVDYTRPSGLPRLPAPVPVEEAERLPTDAGEVEVTVSANVPVEISTPTAQDNGDTVVTYPEIEEPSEPLPQWNQPLEQSRRNTLVPYVIHRREYGVEGDESNGYETKNLLYYDTDGVLIDADDDTVVNLDRVVGANNLKWGHGSQDHDVVFVRNDKLKIEMEIHKIDESYEGEVLGLDSDDSAA